MGISSTNRRLPEPLKTGSRQILDNSTASMPIRISKSWDAFGFSNLAKIMNRPTVAGFLAVSSYDLMAFFLQIEAESTAFDSRLKSVRYVQVIIVFSHSSQFQINSIELCKACQPLVNVYLLCYQTTCSILARIFRAGRYSKTDKATKLLNRRNRRQNETRRISFWRLLCRQGSRAKSSSGASPATSQESSLKQISISDKAWDLYSSDSIASLFRFSGKPGKIKTSN